MHVQLGVSRTTKIRTFAAMTAILLLLAILASPVLARTKIKKAKASENPEQFAAFSHPLANDVRARHALDRLTFGPRPDDLRRVEKMGLNKWLDAQLHPERLPENPLLEERLEPLETLRLDIHDIYVHYPPPQMIAAVARGNAPLPDDPELRAIVVRLADRYLERSDKASANKDPNDDSDLELKVKITDILTSEQIETLQSGKPEEKQSVLESIPESKLADFSWSLYRNERQSLLPLAPVDLRRQLMRAVNPQSVVTSDLCEGKLLRAIYSTRQSGIAHRFLVQPFQRNMNKGADHYLSSYERDAIRPRVFGKFFDICLKRLRVPAMLFYLDNWQSVGPEENYRRVPKPKAQQSGA